MWLTVWQMPFCCPISSSLTLRMEERQMSMQELIAEKAGAEELVAAVKELNQKLGIPASFKEVIPEEEKYMGMLDELAQVALADGCTKTNPIIPTLDQLKELFVKAYKGE